MKRKLLDQLAAGHDFPVPPSMVEAEFGQIWEQLKHEATHEADPDAALAEMEAERDDYQRDRRAPRAAGLLLSEIGQANGVEVTSQEMNRLIAQAAQQYGQEDQQRFIQYVQQEPMAAAQLRAPLYEDKVVDFLFAKAEISDREVTREELEEAIESEDGFATGTHTHDHDNHKPKARKKAKAKTDGTGDRRPRPRRRPAKADDEPAAPDEDAPSRRAGEEGGDQEGAAPPRPSAGQEAGGAGEEGAGEEVAHLTVMPALCRDPRCRKLRSGSSPLHQAWRVPGGPRLDGRGDGGGMSDDRTTHRSPAALL